MPWPRRSIEWRSPSGTRGRRAATKVIKITVSCITLLFLTWCSSIGEAPCATLVNHTPTPGGRATTILSMLSTKRSSGIDNSCRRWRTSDEPWRQQSINPRIAPPTVDGHAIEQDGRDQHGAGDGDAVGAGQILGCLEQHDDQQGADHQQPIGRWNVNLSGFVARCRYDPHARAKSHLHRLPCEGEDAGDERLRRDDGRQRR